jgi:hypothetical protein
MCRISPFPALWAIVPALTFSLHCFYFIVAIYNKKGLGCQGKSSANKQVFVSNAKRAFGKKTNRNECFLD